MKEKIAETSIVKFHKVLKVFGNLMRSLETAQNFWIFCEIQ